MKIPYNSKAIDNEQWKDRMIQVKDARETCVDTINQQESAEDNNIPQKHVKRKKRKTCGRNLQSPWFLRLSSGQEIQEFQFSPPNQAPRNNLNPESTCIERQQLLL